MVLVDTTVWIDFFAGRDRPHTAALQALIERDGDLCLCGVILAEVLQGIRADSEYRKTRLYLDVLVFLPMHRGVFVRSAEIYRSLRKQGITIRKPVDCMIASVAIEYDLPLLHNDRDFNRIAGKTKLKIVQLETPATSSRRHSRGQI